MLMKKAEEVAIFSRNVLKSYLKEWGRLRYSGAETLQLGDIYLLGLNPAGVSDNEEDYLEHDINMLPTRTANAYYDEDWLRIELQRFCR